MMLNKINLKCCSNHPRRDIFIKTIFLLDFLISIFEVTALGNDKLSAKSLEQAPVCRRIAAIDYFKRLFGKEVARTPNSFFLKHESLSRTLEKLNIDYKVVSYHCDNPNLLKGTITLESCVRPDLEGPDTSDNSIFEKPDFILIYFEITAISTRIEFIPYFEINQGGKSFFDQLGPAINRKLKRIPCTSSEEAFSESRGLAISSALACANLIAKSFDSVNCFCQFLDQKGSMKDLSTFLTNSSDSDRGNLSVSISNWLGSLDQPLSEKDSRDLVQLLLGFYQANKEVKFDIRYLWNMMSAPNISISENIFENVYQKEIERNGEKESRRIVKNVSITTSKALTLIQVMHDLNVERNQDFDAFILLSVVTSFLKTPKFTKDFFLDARLLASMMRCIQYVENQRIVGFDLFCGLNINDLLNDGNPALSEYCLLRNKDLFLFSVILNTFHSFFHNSEGCAVSWVLEKTRKKIKRFDFGEIDKFELVLHFVRLGVPVDVLAKVLECMGPLLPTGGGLFGQNINDLRCELSQIISGQCALELDSSSFFDKLSSSFVPINMPIERIIRLKKYSPDDLNWLMNLNRKLCVARRPSLAHLLSSIFTFSKRMHYKQF